MNIILPFRSELEQRAAVTSVADHLRAGGLVAYPTETVYGFGSTLRDDALDRLAQLKGGRDHKPFLLLLRSAADAAQLRWTDAARKLAQCYWPGPLTLALHAPGAYPARVTSDHHTVAVRVSPHRGVQILLEALGEPITSTSANYAGRPAAADAHTLQHMLSEAGVDDMLILDGGPASATTPSTLVDCSVDPPRILREGVLPAAEIERCLHEL